MSDLAATTSRQLTDTEYLRAITLCRSAVEAHGADDGGPTVAGHFLGQLRVLLGSHDCDTAPDREMTRETGREGDEPCVCRTQFTCMAHEHQGGDPL